MSDPGNTLSTATSLSLTTSQTFSNSVSSSDIDFFRLNFTRSSNLNVTLRLSSGSADLALIRDRNGNGVIDPGEIIAQSVNERGLTELINLTRLDPGEYYLQVAVKAGDTSIANYTLEAASDSLKRSPATVDWRDATTGALTIWAVNDTAIEETRTYSVPTDWQIAARGDFNGDGNTDLFWRNSSGGTSIWLMQGAEILSAVNPATVGVEWQVKFVGDLNGDGKEDLFWQHVTSGEAALWTLDGTIPTGGRLINFGPGWQLVGVGDFNANGRTDWIWQHPTQGLVTQELLDGLTQGESRTWNIGGNWAVQASADFNGDRTSDLIWQTPTGEIAFWLMQGLNFDGIVYSVAQTQQFTPTYSAEWKLQETGDFDGDGKADLLWGNSTTGNFSIWLMNGYTVKSASSYTVGANWRIQGVVDLNGDGRSDIIWHDGRQQAAFWTMNGTAVSSGTVVNNVAAGWQAEVRKTLGNLPQPIDEAGNSRGTAFKAGILESYGQYNGRLSRQDTSDFYELFVPNNASEASFRYSFDLVSNTTTLEFTLLDQEGRVIQRSDSLNRGLDTIQTRLAPGTYYLQVSAEAGAVVQPIDYRLNLTRISTPTARLPVLGTISPITTRLGETREVQLVATDPDGEKVTFALRTIDKTPPITLSPDGKLVIKSAPGQEGTYQFEVVASDSQGSTRQIVTLQVNTTRTRRCGLLLSASTCNIRAIDNALSYRRSRTVRSRKNRFLYLPPLGHPERCGADHAITSTVTDKPLFSHSTQTKC